MVRNIYTCIVGVGVGGKSMRGKSWQLMATVAGGVIGILTNQAAYPQSRPYLHTQQYVWKLRLFTQHRQDTSFKPHYVIQLARKILKCLQPVTKYISSDILCYVIFGI